MAKKTVKERIEEAGMTVSTEPLPAFMEAALDKIEASPAVVHPEQRPWEYDVVAIQRGEGMKRLHDELKFFGDNGWELVHVDGSPYVYELFFKRRKV